MQVDRMFGIINLGVSVSFQKFRDFIYAFFKITDYPGVNATPEQMWADVQAGISVHVTELLDFAKDVRR